MTLKAPPAFHFIFFFGPRLCLVFFCLLLPSGPLKAAAGVEQPDLLDQGRVLLRARAYELALNRFLLIERNSENPGEKSLALRMIGETQFKNGDYASAYQAYQQSLRLTPLSSSKLNLEFKAAVSLIYLKKYDSALQKLGPIEARVKDKSFLTDLYFWEGECYFQLGQYDLARAEYEKIFATNIHYQYVYLVRYLESWCAFQQKDYDEALKGFGEVQSKTDNPVLKKLALFQVAESFYRAGRYPDAEKTYQGFLKQYPGDSLRPAASYGLGWTFEKESKTSDAIHSFESVYQNNPEDPLAAWAAVREGADAFVNGDGALALKSYQKALDLAKGKAPADLAEFGLGWLAFSAGRYDESASHFQKVSSFIPASQLLWDADYLRAGAAYLQGDYPGAEKIYELCSAGAPGDLAGASRFWLAWCDYHIGRYEDAESYFKKLADEGNALWKSRALWGAGESAYQLIHYAEALSLYQSALDVDNCPVSLECYSGIGWSYFELEKYPESYAAFQKAAGLNPKSPLAFEAQLRSGDCLYNQHQYDKARVLYEKIIQNHDGAPYELDALEQLGWCAYRSEDFSTAAQNWKKLSLQAGAEDRGPRLFYWMAWAYFRDKEYQKAADQFKAVESTFPNDPLAPESHLREGDCYFNLKDFHASKQVYKDFLDRYPNHPLVPDALYGLQWSAEKLGDKDEADQEAQAFMTKYPASPYSPDIELRLADSRFHAQDYAAAVTQYQDFIQKFPQSNLMPRAFFWLGTALVKEGKMDEAAPQFQKVMDQYPADSLALESQFSLASIYFEQNNFSKALSGYSDIVGRYPDHRLAPHALFNSAVCEKQLGRPDKALDDFVKLSQNYPQDPLAFEAQVQRGILLEKANRQSEALEAYAKAAQSPDSDLAVEAAFYHADLKRQLKQYPQAIQEFNDLAAKFPDEDQWVVTALAQIAKCYEEQKKYDKAYKAYERILKYTKDKTYQAATLKHMKALKPFLKKSPPSAKPASIPTVTAAEATR